MKKTLKSLISLLLAAVLAVSMPLQVFADTTDEKYISEIKIGVGRNASQALSALDGYEILKDGNGNYVDLNKDAGGGAGSQGNRVVYLGFKRTSLQSEAITDLAVMNMNGGYSVKDYKALMDDYISEQLLPFVDSFMAAIVEYRENYNSENENNRARAEYIHDALNKLTDDDCGGAGLGDLLLNETRYEMGDAAYNALSDAEKNQHADIVTIIAQANGRATLLLESLLLKSADSNENTWLERLVEVTYDDLADETGLSPSKARNELNLLYYDDAMKILQMWTAFKEQLDGYDEAIAKLEEAKQKDFSEQEAIIEKYDIEATTDGQTQDFAQALAEVTTYGEVYTNAYYDVLCKEYLESIEYDLTDYDLEVETLLDLFTLDYDTAYDNIECLYPIVASLSDGQRAGLELITLQDLVVLGMNDVEGYRNAEYDEFEIGSIYEGVDRGIYEEGGVALTSDALRTDALSRVVEEADGYKLGALTYAGISVAGASAIGLGVSLGFRHMANNAISAYHTELQSLKDVVKKAENRCIEIENYIDTTKDGYQARLNAVHEYNEIRAALPGQKDAVKRFEDIKYLGRLEARSALCNRIALGCTIAFVIITAITIWMTAREMRNYYKVDYSAIPHYIVDEKDITAYNANGDKIVIKNQGAYYKSVPCNRTSDAPFYDVLGEHSDLNGDVGRQWLALYAERNEAKDPILANSFKISTSDQIPLGYEYGIHMFGSTAAENLNNPLYDWNSTAPKVYVYFKLDVGAAGTAGSSFSRGTVALSGVSGLVTGALAAALIMTTAKKKKEEALCSQ